MTDERTIKPLMGERFDCVVIGAGHGGCEAALACARLICALTERNHAAYPPRPIFAPLAFFAATIILSPLPA